MREKNWNSNSKLPIDWRAHGGRLTLACVCTMWVSPPKKITRSFGFRRHDVKHIYTIYRGKTDNWWKEKCVTHPTRWFIKRANFHRGRREEERKSWNFNFIVDKWALCSVFFLSFNFCFGGESRYFQFSISLSQLLSRWRPQKPLQNSHENRFISLFTRCCLDGSHSLRRSKSVIIA